MCVCVRERIPLVRGNLICFRYITPISIITFVRKHRFRFHETLCCCGDFIQSLPIKRQKRATHPRVCNIYFKQINSFLYCKIEDEERGGGRLSVTLRTGQTRAIM